MEKSIYDISVSRRMSHIGGKDGAPAATGKNRSAELNESAIEAANSQELQQAPLSKLLTRGPGGGEMVDTDDLWSCLFQKGREPRKQVPLAAAPEVARHMGTCAAEAREMVHAE